MNDKELTTNANTINIMFNILAVYIDMVQIRALVHMELIRNDIGR